MPKVNFEILKGGKTLVKCDVFVDFNVALEILGEIEISIGEFATLRGVDEEGKAFLIAELNVGG